LIVGLAREQPDARLYRLEADRFIELTVDFEL
jgi:hypothetical protein